MVLARLNIAGGNIRNIALNAAFLAAESGEPVRMTHVLRSARTEYAKLEKPLAEIGIGVAADGGSTKVGFECLTSGTNSRECAGHEHRIRPIAARAAEIFGERISGLCPSVDLASRTGHLDALIAPGLNLDLARISDEQVAKQIADAWLEALARHLGV